MKNTIFIILFLTLFLSSCSNRQVKQYPGASSKERIYSPVYSKNFEIDSVSGSSNILISSKNPWQGARDVSKDLYIVKEVDNSGEVSNFIIGSANRIVCMSSTHIAMLDALGAVDRIVGVSGKQYISNPQIRNNVNIPDVGYEGNINYEAILAAKPDIILLFSVNGMSGMEPKLKELGIPFLYIGDYVEENPLGKAEWMVALAEIIGEREKGIKTFNEIVSRYNNLKKIVEDSEIEHPSVMVNAPFSDSWFMPSSSSYVAQLIEDAGASYIYGKNTGSNSSPIDMEEALQLVSNTDYWINISEIRNKNELVKAFPKFAKVPCVANDRIYNNNFKATPGGGNDYYESGVVNPHLVLRDMIKIFHPHLIKEDFTYYHQLQ